MRVFGLVLPLLAASFLVQAPAAAADLDVKIRFSSNEISVIHDFFHDYHSDNRVDKKGGKKGSKPLPPGIAKNLERGKSLPPGIAKRSLPNDLVVRLPPVADGYERVVIAGKILLVEIATQVIHDVLVEVLLD
jgi:hypothetical protein